MSTSYTQHLYAGYSLLQVFYSIVFCNYCHHLVMYYISFEIFCQLLLTLFFHSSLRLASHYIRMVLSSYLHLELHHKHHIHSFGLHFRYYQLTLWYFQYYCNDSMLYHLHLYPMICPMINLVLYYRIHIL